MQEFTGILEAGEDILFRDLRIALKNPLVAPAGGQQIHDELHGDSRAGNDRLTGQYARIDCNSGLLFHELIIAD